MDLVFNERFQYPIYNLFKEILFFIKVEDFILASGLGYAHSTFYKWVGYELHFVKIMT
jgi:hypothetical protein